MATNNQKAYEALLKKGNLGNPDHALTSYNYAASAAPRVPAPANQSFNFGNFAKNVATSVPRIAGQAATSFVSGLQKNFSDVATGIVQATQQGANTQALDSRRMASQAMMAKYTKDFKAGKIDKKRYNTLLKGLQQEFESGANDAASIAGEYVTPEAFTTGAAVVGSLPFAFGKLSGAGIGGRAGALANKIPSVAKATAQPFNPTLKAGLATLAKAPLKQALVTGPNANVASELVIGAMNKDAKKFGAAAGWAALPAGVSLAGKAAKSGKGLLKNALFDTSGVFDRISLKDGKSVIQHLDDVAKTDAGKAKQYEDILKVAQDNILKQYKGDAMLAADAISEYVQGKNLAKMSIGKFAKELDALASTTKNFQTKAEKVLKAGKEIVDANGKPITKEMLGRVGAVKSTQKEVNSLAKLIRESTSADDLQQKLSQWIIDNDRFAQNAQNKRIIERLMDDAAKGGGWGPIAAEQTKMQLKGTNQLFVKTASGKLKPVLGENGYYMGIRNKEAANFAKSANDVAALDRGNKAIFGKVGEAIRATGLSPETVTEGQSNAIYKKVKSTFLQKVDDLKIIRESETGSQVMTGNTVFKGLTKFAETKKSVTDLRQLTAGEVSEALSLSKGDARKVLKAYKESFSGLNLKERGLAGKIQDLNLRVNPIAAPYSRVQAAARYTYNPFFSMQERIETRAGVAALAGTTPRPGKDYQKTINTLKDTDIFTRAGAGSEGADVTFGTITSRLKPGQERTIAAGVETLAERQGVSVADFVRKNPDLMQDFKTIVQYPDKGFTSSNMAKMLNLAVFPARYNIKVAQFAVKQLAKQPGPVQIGIVKSINDFDQFLQSEEGMKWQSENSEILGILNYFTPIYPISQVMNTLKGRTKAVGDIGSLGGLPFGIISQLLQNQGVIPQLNRPYIDPKTGEVYPEKIPQSLRARTHSLLSDLVGTMYNYPGRIVGLPSKRTLNETFPTGVIGKPKSSEYTDLPVPKLTPQEQKKSDTLSKKTSSVPSLQAGAVTKVPLQAVPKITPKAIYKGSSKGKKAKTRAVPIGRPF